MLCLHVIYVLYCKCLFLFLVKVVGKIDFILSDKYLVKRRVVMETLTILFLIIDFISATNKGVCSKCQELRDENGSTYFIFPHETLIYTEVGKIHADGDEMHKIHLTCLTQLIAVDERSDVKESKRLSCTICAKSISSSLLLALEIEFSTLALTTGKKDAVGNLKIWLNVLTTHTLIAFIIFENNNTGFYALINLLTFVTKCYPLYPSIVEHRIFAGIIHALLKESFPLKIYPDTYNFYSVVTGCSVEDIQRFYTNYYDKMNIFTRNRFDELLITSLVKQKENKKCNSPRLNRKRPEKCTELCKLEGFILLWKTVFYPSQTRNLFTCASKIQKICRRKTNARRPVIRNVQNALNIFFVYTRRTSCDEDSLEIKSALEARFLIPAVLYELEKETQRGRATDLYRKFVFIKAIECVRDNITNLNCFVFSWKLLFMYMGNAWFNEIYNKTGDVVWNGQDLNTELRKLSEDFLRSFIKAMTNIEYTLCLEFFNSMCYWKQRNIFLETKLIVFDLLYESFISRTIDDASIFYLVKVFTKIGYLTNFIGG